MGGAVIVVTGGTGHLGNVLLRRLADGGTNGLRAILRPGRSPESLAGLDLEIVPADVHDQDSLARAFRGAEIVYHLAGIVSIATRASKQLRTTNVEGTRNVIAACRRAGVGRLVYTSSVHAFVEPPRGTPLVESAMLDPSRVRGPYAQTKAEATRLVLDAAGQDLDAVVVFPSSIVGPCDFGLSHMGRLILDCSSGRLRAYVEGCYDFVDVRDVAQGAIAAAKKGDRGQGYILSGHPVTVADVLHTTELITGVEATRLRLPNDLARAAATIMPAYYALRREKPRFTRYSLAVIASNPLMSHEKATRELGFSPRPFVDTVRDAVDWFRERGMLESNEVGLLRRPGSL